MDLWDLTKLLFRRWYVAAPMLLLSAVIVVFVAKTVGPDYSAKGHVQIIPAPSAGKAVDPAAKPRPTNPWIDLGYEALANAAALAVTDQEALQGLVDRGFSDSVTVTMDDNTVLLEIEAIAPTSAQATATVQEVIRLIAADIAAKQKQYGVLPEDTITSLTLNDGSSPEVVRSKVMRVLVVAAGVGVLMTIAGTIALDALLRRRLRRRTDVAEAAAADVVTTARLAAQTSPKVGNNGNGAAKAAIVEPIRIRTPASSNGDDQPTGRLPAMPPIPAETSKSSVQAVEYKSANAADSKARDGDGTKGNDMPDFPPVGADATIVLPLSHMSWRADKKP
ncbi:hypothetical protein [Phytohabitans rumicis]|uniref:hypothetical protein n=1 Tax=Phytohabitans rumicis TaxID=1076125 RepID=UPI001564334D|nr:hypothetical protein [Phytohabitans rumicis]